MDVKISAHFQELLLQYTQETEPEKRKWVQDIIWKEFGGEHTVFVLDMSGFSLLTRKYGIVHYMSMVRRMQLTVEPIVKKNGGTFVKFEADNCFAVFPDTHSAIQAAISMQLAFDESNLITDDELDIHISCGIDHGKILMIGSEDCYGDAINRACKMGEDLASAGQIFVGADAMERLAANSGIISHPITVSISGVALPAFSIEYKTNS
jgi:adenylate cyclase